MTSWLLQAEITNLESIIRSAEFNRDRALEAAQRAGCAGLVALIQQEDKFKIGRLKSKLIAKQRALAEGGAR
jgi:hypothetical protein